VTAPASVDAYLAALPPDQRRALESLRATIAAAAPHATETISYQMPAFKDGDRLLVSYAAFKDHCSLFPMSTAVIAADADALAPFVAGKGTLRFTVEEPLPSAVVERIVRARLEENEARRRARR
jgi:uncharacterized protein YdhG (YjbR/CyaY superfamily)